MKAATHDTTTTVIQKLAELGAGVTFDQLPAPVVHEARRRLLDALGVMLGGAGGESMQTARAAALALGGQDQATLIGAPERTSIDRAALVNGTALRYLDYMDGHPGPYPCHACSNIPPILAVAEWTGASGADVARAIVLGYEAQIRLQLGAGDPTISEHGWAGPTNLGLSVPLAISGMLGLSTEQTAHAVGISLTHAPALDVSSRGQMAASKSCLDAMVAMSAVVATLLAREGMTAPLAAFEGRGGYVQAVARQWDETLVLASMDRFRILDVYDKRYNAGKYGQTTVAAGLKVLASLPGGWRDIERITLRLAERDYRQQLEDEPARRRPEGRDTANHSIYYCLAAALVDGDLLPAQFEPARLRDPDILRLVDRITLGTDPELTRYWPSANPAEVEVVTRAGQLYRERVLYAPGHPRNPLSDDQLQAKFRGLAAAVLAPDHVERVLELVMQLDRLPSIRRLMDLVRRDASALAS